MSAIFAGSSRALLTSVVFAFETTGQPAGLLPLLGGCSAAYLVSGLFMRTTIMTEKIVRRGIEVPMDYDADYLALTRVSAAFTENPITFPGAATLRDIRQTIAGSPEKRHHAYPVLDAQGLLMGIVTERELMNGSLPADQRLEQLIRKPPAVVYPQSSLRYAADLMIQQGVGRLAVVNPEAPRHIIGILTRSDILSVHKKRLRDAHHAERSLHLRRRKAK